MANISEDYYSLEFALDLVYDEMSNVRLSARKEVKRLWKKVFDEEIKIIW